MKLTIELEVSDCDRRQLNNVLAALEHDIFRLIKSSENGMEDNGAAYGKNYTLSVEITD